LRWDGEKREVKSLVRSKRRRNLSKREGGLQGQGSLRDRRPKEKGQNSPEKSLSQRIASWPTLTSGEKKGRVKSYSNLAEERGYLNEKAGQGERDLSSIELMTNERLEKDFRVAHLREDIFRDVCKNLISIFHRTGDKRTAWRDSIERDRKGKRVVDGKINQNGHRPSLATTTKRDGRCQFRIARGKRGREDSNGELLNEAGKEVGGAREMTMRRKVSKPVGDQRGDQKDEGREPATLGADPEVETCEFIDQREKRDQGSRTALLLRRRKEEKSSCH